MHGQSNEKLRKLLTEPIQNKSVHSADKVMVFHEVNATLHVVLLLSVVRTRTHCKTRNTK